MKCTSTTVQKACARKIEHLEADGLVLQEKRAAKPCPKRNFEDMFDLVMNFLASPWKLWSLGHIEDKRSVLKLAISGRLGVHRKQDFEPPKPSCDSTREEETTCEIVQWRRDRDSNPGSPRRGQRISNPPRSTTPAPLRGGLEVPDSGSEITVQGFSRAKFALSL